MIDRHDRVGVSRKALFSVAVLGFACGGNVEKALLLCGIISKRTREFLRELSFYLSVTHFRLGNFML